MISFLKGTIDFIGSNWVEIDVQNVGYKAFCSGRTLSSLSMGEAVRLTIYTHVREQEITLFGFSSANEREMFEKLTSVSGVGPKVGLAILSTLTPSEILEAVTLQNGSMIARATGVGPKLGERVVRELKGKLGALTHVESATGGEVTARPTGVAHDVLSALTNLGYKPDHAQKALVTASESNPNAPFDTLLKATLQELR